MASIKELLSAMIAKINGKNEGVDWNENNETSLAFVKNRPFYTGDIVFTEIIPEQTYTLSPFIKGFTMYSDESGTYSYSLEEGKDYTVVYNGTTYELISISVNGIASVGDLSPLTTGSKPSVPFGIGAGGGILQIVDYTGNTEVTFKISSNAPEIKQIDTKYIPWNDAVGLYPPVFIDKSVSDLTDEEKQKYYDLFNKGSLLLARPEGQSTWHIVTSMFYSGTVGLQMTLLDSTGTLYTYNSDGWKTNNITKSGITSTVDGVLSSKTTWRLLNKTFDSVSSGKAFNAYIAWNDSTEKACIGKESKGPSGVGTVLASNDIICSGDKEIVLSSSTADSTKKYKITVDDSGAITSTDTSDSSISYTPYSPPAVTEADAGKFLRVSSTGEWVAEKPTYTASDVGAAAESHDHNLQDLSGTVPLSKGGTGANNATDALANLGAFRFLGNDVITSIDNDTTSNWVASGSGYAFFSNNGLINDQPSQWGIVVNFVTGSDVFQMWRAQTTGPTYWRSGNASGWNGTWNKVYDTANKPAFGDLDGQPTPILSSTDVSAVERTQYTYIGNMLVMSGITPEVECANNAVTSYNVWFPKTFSSACVVMSSLYYNNDDPSLSNKVSAVAGWYRNDTVVIKFANTSGATRKLRASWLAIGM